MRALRGRLWEASKLIMSIPNIEGRKILDVGCGPRAIIRNIHGAIGLDLKVNTVIEAKRHQPWNFFVAGDIEQPPFACNSFDLMIACDVIEHVVHDVEMIKQTKRLLRKGGILLLTTPNDRFVYRLLDHQRWIRKHRHYGAEEIKQLLQRTDFKVTKIYEKGFILSPLFGLALLPFDLLDRVTFGFPGRIGNFMRKIAAPIVNVEYKLELPFGYSIFVLAENSG